MESSSVKAAVKTWEKSFKAQNGRPPTKKDVKQDPSGIGEWYSLCGEKVLMLFPAEQYALYRTLSKPGSSAHHASSSSDARVESSTSTQRTEPIPNQFTTPTPPPRSVNPSRSNGESYSELTNALKRTASKAVLNTSPNRSASRPSSITPKKPRPMGFAGPIHDPNPVNPFAVTPTRPTSAIAPAVQVSPYIHASSPRKLKDVLELNSLRKVREREELSPMKEITPRTRARKRLKGEVVDDTPVKEKIPRRKRGSARVQEMDKGKGKESVGEEEDDAEEMGPSPWKAANTRVFTSLLGEIEVQQATSSKSGPMEKGKGRQTDMMSFFGRASNGKAKDVDQRPHPAEAPSIRHTAPEEVVLPEPTEARSGSARPRSPRGNLFRTK